MQVIFLQSALLSIDGAKQQWLLIEIPTKSSLAGIG